MTDLLDWMETLDTVSCACVCLLLSVPYATICCLISHFFFRTFGTYDDNDESID